MKHSSHLRSAMRHTSLSTGLVSGYICLQCRHRALPITQNTRIFHPVPTPFRRYASSESPNYSFTERLRRRMWKGEPPGQKDPYSFEERDALVAEADVKRVAKEKAIAKAVARRMARASRLSEHYVPATSGEGLEQVGGATGWWEEAWDKENQFEGFMAPSKMQSKEDVSFAIHRALVEVYTLQDAGLPIVIPAWAETPYDSDWGEIGFQQTEDGITIPIFPNENIKQEILQSLTKPKPVDEPDSAAFGDGVEGLDNKESKTNPNTTMLEENQTPVEEEVSSEGALEALNVDSLEEAEDDIEQEQDTESSTPSILDPSWFKVPLDDMTIKFAVLKRVMQLTGIRIPDPAIADLTSAKALLGHLVRKPKPKKLAERLTVNENLTSLPNIQIMDRRYTPIDKEKEIGRWKIIERELIQRNLPVTGDA